MGLLAPLATRAQLFIFDSFTSDGGTVLTAHNPDIGLPGSWQRLSSNDDFVVQGGNITVGAKNRRCQRKMARTRERSTARRRLESFTSGHCDDLAESSVTKGAEGAAARDSICGRWCGSLTLSKEYDQEVRMASSTITSKGQITVPKKIREALKVRPGDRLAFRQRPDGTVVVEPETLDANLLVGCLTRKTSVRGVTVEQMNETIRKAGGRR